MRRQVARHREKRNLTPRGRGNVAECKQHHAASQRSRRRTISRRDTRAYIVESGLPAGRRTLSQSLTGGIATQIGPPRQLAVMLLPPRGARCFSLYIRPKCRARVRRCERAVDGRLPRRAFRRRAQRHLITRARPSCAGSPDGDGCRPGSPARRGSGGRRRACGIRDGAVASGRRFERARQYLQPPYRSIDAGHARTASRRTSRRSNSRPFQRRMTGRK